MDGFHFILDSYEKRTIKQIIPDMKTICQMQQFDPQVFILEEGQEVSSHLEFTLQTIDNIPSDLEEKSVKNMIVNSRGYVLIEYYREEV